MRILVIQHSAADTAAAAGSVMECYGHDVHTIRIDCQDDVPQTVDADVLMMFGGAISLTSPDRPPWVEREQSLVRSYASEGRRIVGICLGAQILASALGARVRRNTQPEVGWHSVQRVDQPQGSTLVDVFPQQLTVLQWHQDTFGIPDGATRLLKSDACENQAFAIDDRIFGFQCHLEANARTVRMFLAASGLLKRQAPFIQNKSEIMEGIETHLPTQTRILQKFLTRFLVNH